jgi:acyl carrier protein
VDTKQQVLQVLASVLNLGGRASQLTLESPLLGALPELDSISVVSMLTALEDRFGITVEDDDVDGRTFATLGNLVAFVEAKLAA